MKQPSQQAALNRRHLLGGAGTAGALAAAAVLVPARDPAQAVEPSAAKPEQGGGYRVTAHVLRYYQTAKV
jgi:hypothetical protein